MSPTTLPFRYGVVVPVKPRVVAKSRLRPLGDEARAGLVVAFAVDTIQAALESPQVARVLVMTDDHELAGDLAEMGVEVIPDGTSRDLNASLVLAAAELHRRDPELRVAALCADLPALRSDELTRVLAAAPDGVMSFVADSDHVGTTAVLAPEVQRFRPRFGHGSRAAHLAAGAHEIELVDVPSVRRDVDTPADLEAARELGLGPRSAMLVTGLRL
jgi:2-phospho-L-lactate guanylyltransferase